MSEEARERGKRIRLLRNSLRFSRIKFAEKHGISRGTLQSLEEGRYEGVTEENVEKLMQIFKAEGINCSTEWILYGSGRAPLLFDSSLTIPTEILNLNDEMARELNLFCQHHPNAIDTIVQDDAMEPFVFAGDMIAGKRYFDADLIKIINLNCIIQTRSGEILVRHIEQKTEQGFTLTCINPATHVKEKILTNIQILSAAPIMWIRRADPVTK